MELLLTMDVLYITKTKNFLKLFLQDQKQMLIILLKKGKKLRKLF